MIFASPTHSAATLSSTSSSSSLESSGIKSRLLRRNTISDSRSMLSQKRTGRQVPLTAKPTNLDSVLEQSTAFSSCCRLQSDYMLNESHCSSSSRSSIDAGTVVVPSVGKSKTLPRNFSKNHPEIVMAAWKAAGTTTKQTSPSNSSITGTEAASSWLETISTKISEKKRKSGIFGSLRGRNKDKKKDSITSAPDTTDTTQNHSSLPPRSPLLAKTSKTMAADTGSSSVSTAKKSVIQMKPSFEFHSSTGFQQVDPLFNPEGVVKPSVDLIDSGHIEKKSLARTSSREYWSPSKGFNVSGEHKSVNQVKKANSLPRNVLCSPVLSRKGKNSTNLEWSRDITGPLDDIILGHRQSSSPPSSNMSSRIGSVDTLQPSINMSEEQGGMGPVVTPTTAEGWQHPVPNRQELVPKTSLTRSSSLPFEAEILTSDQSMGKNTLERNTSSSGGGGGGMMDSQLVSSGNRAATRSQSFNTHYNSHAVVRKTSSLEEMKMRERVLTFLLETEQSYIHSLKLLTQEYRTVLLNNGVLEDIAVMELFIAVDELVSLHQVFASNIEKRLSKWSRSQMIGDLLLDMFTSNLLPNVYGRYIQYYSTARASIEHLRQNRPSLVRELEDCYKDNHGRLDLKDLLIKPVQRIPRYMLFVKDIMKYTNHTHPDYALLQQSLSELSDLAECVNETERVSDRLQQHKELLSTVEGLSECLTSNSMLLRCDAVTEMKGSVQRKDRMLLLFSDVVICAAIRRKSSGFRRGSLMNINSTLTTSETTRYLVKWCSQLSSLSVTRSQAPLFERRRYNTLEKHLHNSQKDEALLIQMMSLSSTLHCEHLQLNQLLQDMLDGLRSGMSNRQHEIDTLPHDSARLDLISHDCGILIVEPLLKEPLYYKQLDFVLHVPAAKYFLTFISQKERQQWERTLRNAQLSSAPSTANLSRIKVEDNDYAPPTSSSPQVQRQSSIRAPPMPKLMSHLSIPSCRVGAELSSAVVVTIGSSYPQLFITINDTCGRGSVAIINTSNSVTPRLVATLPLSSSSLLCSVCVLHPSSSAHDGNDASFSLSDSGDIPFFNESSNYCPVPLSAAVERRGPPMDKDTPFDMLRSSSAPPTSHHMINNDPILNGWTHVPNDAPPVLSTEQWLWLGSEGGVVYLLKVGVSSLHVGTSITFELDSSVECLVFHNNKVWAGLRDGRIAVFKLQPEITYQYRAITNTDAVGPVTCLAPVGHMILAATGNKVVGVSALTESHKDQLELDGHHQIIGITVSEQLVCLALRDSLLVFMCTFGKDGTLEPLCTMDCTNPVLSMLKNYDPIVKQHKCSFPRVTSMSCTDHALIIGTSTGVVVYLALPLIPGHTPSPQPLVTGHVDRVSLVNTMSAAGQDGSQLLITGGHGLEDLMKGRLYNNVSETEGCVSLWELPITSPVE